MIPFDQPHLISFHKGLYDKNGHPAMITPDLPNRYAQHVDKWAPLVSQASSDPKNCLTPGAIRNRRLLTIMLENQAAWYQRHKALQSFADVLEKVREKHDR